MSRPLLYLASGSPRRREILESLGYAVERLPVKIDETPEPGEAAQDYVLRMAVEKNAVAVNAWYAGHADRPPYPVLAADTAVALDNRILGKPESPQHAEAMLRLLSGTVHQVLSAVCVCFRGEIRHIVQISDVRFKTLSDAEIRTYTDSGEPLDKAGAYGIQGTGGVFVQDLRGSFTGVMGLPVFETAKLLADAGYAVPPFAVRDNRRSMVGRKKMIRVHRLTWQKG